VASEVTPVSGAIGAACEVPAAAAKSNAATVIAKRLRFIPHSPCSSFVGAKLCERITRKQFVSPTVSIGCDPERIVVTFFVSRIESWAKLAALPLRRTKSIRSL
jgi:hypothetical protein